MRNAECVATRPWWLARALLAAFIMSGAVQSEDVAFKAIPSADPFTGYVLTEGLDFPWEMLWGPDDMLWISERHGLRITRVNPATGEKRVAGRISEAYPGPQHEGVLGMAFGPNFLKSV